MTLTRLLFVLPFAALLAGCVASDSSGIEVAERAEMRAKLRPAFGSPIFIRGSTRVMYPFAAESAQTEKEVWGISPSYIVIGSAASGIVSYDKSGDSSLRWNNVAFYDPGTGETRLLFDAPVLIAQFYRPNERGPVFDEYLLFGVAQEDTNRDGRINNEDAVVLMATDVNGNGPPRLLSSPNDQLVDVQATQYDPDWLYFRVRRDTDGDREFTNKDTIESLRIQPKHVLHAGKDGDPQRVLSEEIRAQAFDVVLRAARKVPAR